MTEETKVEVKVDDKEKPVVVTNDNLKDLDIKQDKKVETKTEDKKVDDKTKVKVEDKKPVVVTNDNLKDLPNVDVLNEQIKTLTNINKEYEAKIKAFEKKEFDKLLDENKNILSKLDVEKSNANYDLINSVKSDFIIPEDGDKVTKEEIEHNINLYKVLSKTNIFSIPDKAKAPVIPKTTEPVKAKIIDPKMENNPILR